MFNYYYPLVNVYITMEDHHFSWENHGKSTISMVMFHSYVTNYQRVTTISVADLNPPHSTSQRPIPSRGRPHGSSVPWNCDLRDPAWPGRSETAVGGGKRLVQYLFACILCTVYIISCTVCRIVYIYIDNWYWYRYWYRYYIYIYGYLMISNPIESNQI